MVYGKFVLLKDGTLFLGSERSFHKDICGYAPQRQVRGAGYFQSCDLQESCVVYGESIGYNMSFYYEDGTRIEKLIFQNAAMITDEEQKSGSRFVVQLNLEIDDE